MPAQNLFVGELFEGFTMFQTGAIDRDEFMRREIKYVLYVTGVAACSWLFHSLEFMLWLANGELQAKSARDRLFHGLLEKEIEWYDLRKNGIGALLPRLQAQIRELQLATAQPLGSLFSLLSTAILSLVLAVTRSWDLTLVTLATVPLIICLVAWAGNRMQRNLIKQQENLTEAQKYSTSAFSAIETVKCFNGQQLELEKYISRILVAAKWYAWVANSSALQMGFVVLLSVSMFVQGFYYGGILVGRGTLTSGDVITTFFSAISAFQAVQAILPQMIVFEKGRTAGSTLRAIMSQIQSSSKIERLRGLLAPATCHGDIDVKNLSFAYPSRPDMMAVKDISLYIPGGEITFLIGRSGSGKSTISQLLMRFYNATEGEIIVDGNPLASLDTTWLRSNITLVEQQSLLFNDTVFRNIALGRKDYDRVTKEEVIEAVEFALLQLMIAEMPEGLDTGVGFKGGSMSGGQRQRMALARARLRDTPILILDESTSALDNISRNLMMEAIRAWRRGKTTIIITHDISQILADDYVFLLENGRLMQEGYRHHLEQMKDSLFQGFLSEEQRAAIPPDNENKARDFYSVKTRGSSLDSFAHITRMSPAESEMDPLENQLSSNERNVAKRRTYLGGVFTEGSPIIGVRGKGGNVSAFASPWMRMNMSNRGRDFGSNHSERWSPQMAPSLVNSESPVSGKRWSKVFEHLIDQTGRMAAEARSRTAGVTRRLRTVTDGDAIPLVERAKSLEALEANTQLAKAPEMSSLKYIFGTLWPNLTCKSRLYLILGFWGASVHAVASPIFSYILSLLLQTYTVPGGDKTEALQYSMAILGVAFADGIHTWIFRFFHEYTSQLWVDKIRGRAFERIMDQSRDFFEKEENSVSRLTGSLDRNAEEMRNLLGRFASLVYVVVLMLVVSITWALVAQWKMTLIALAVSPYIFGVTKAFAKISEKWEGHSNDAAEGAASIFTETFTNIKSVRALTLETHFIEKYLTATNKALRIGLQRAFYSGFFFGLSDSAGNFSTALIFYVGSKLVADGASIKDIIQVFTMLLFTIGQVSAVLEFIPQIGSSKDTAARLLRLATLPRDSHEHLGDTRITTVGDIVFDDLHFSYPSRPTQTVLKNISLRLKPGTATAIVGGSGSGKSTIANLLLDLYSTSNVPGAEVGDLSLGGRDMKHIYTPSLRSLVVPVSQTPTLFAATAAENIAYGYLNATAEDIAISARQAGIHDFILSLPQGYETPIGDGGMGLSGGQAQRIAIARALVRKPHALVLDEATSALDVESANLVRQTITHLIHDRSRSMTVIIITHHRDMMEIAERVVVLDQGRIAEEGTFAELMGRNGALVNLLSGGEWDAEREAHSGRRAAARGKAGARKSVPLLKDVDWKRRSQTASASRRRPERRPSRRT